MGSSKQISGRETFQLLMLMQQGGLFWMLPVLLIRENGTAGLFGLVPGFLAGLLIIFVCSFWRNRCGELSFLQSLLILLGKPAGKVIGLCFVLLYLAFTVLCLNSFVEVVHTIVLPETPRILLVVSVFILAGWLAWNGLEDISRLAPLAVLLIIVLLLLTLAGSLPNFEPENLLPLTISHPEALRQAMLCSVFSYSSFLILFMIAPALNHTKNMGWQLGLAAVISAIIFLLWTILAIGVFGQFSMNTMVWMPLELACMVQISSFLERTEALFIALWMPVVLVNGSLLFWTVSEGVHQLFEKQKSRWLHWGLAAAAILLCTAVKNLAQMFQLEHLLAAVTAGLIPILLLLIILGTLLHGRRQHIEKEGTTP